MNLWGSDRNDGQTKRMRNLFWSLAGSVLSAVEWALFRIPSLLTTRTRVIGSLGTKSGAIESASIEEKQQPVSYKSCASITTAAKAIRGDIPEATLHRAMERVNQDICRKIEEDAIKAWFPQEPTRTRVEFDKLAEAKHAEVRARGWKGRFRYTEGDFSREFPAVRPLLPREAESEL